MASALVRDLIEAGVHFGHRTSRWNPKMRPFIFGKRNLIYIIDIRETVRGLLLAKKFISSVVGKGQDILFVGTKRAARDAIKTHAESCGMPFVNERWLGGTLTNFRTIRSRLGRLEELESLDATGRINEYSKKMISTLQRERRRITRNLDGIRKMQRLPGALFLVDVKHEHIAVKEARKLGIPTISLIDTDGDPEMVDVAIPGNDDAMRSIDLVLRHMCEAVGEGMRGRPVEPPPDATAADGDSRPAGATPRRSRRMTTTQAVAQEPPTVFESGGDSDSGGDALGTDVTGAADSSQSVAHITK